MIKYETYTKTMNAKKELLKTIKQEDIKCATIEYLDDTISLKVGHTSEEFDIFINKLDFNYDNGYGGQELFGTIWNNDNESWCERSEYDGSEWWDIYELPAIPKELTKQWKFKSFVLENTWLPAINTGWGNGYVVIPKHHPLNGVDYYDIDVDIHGGLTYGTSVLSLRNDDYWKDIVQGYEDDDYIIGFDTSHFGDNCHTCSKEYVERETASLVKQLEEYEIL